MRLLLIHADKFSYQVTERVAELKGAASLPESEQGATLQDCLVVFIAVEKEDEQDLGMVVDRAAGEVRKLAKELAVRRILLYPYAHLAPALSSPSAAIEALQRTAASLEGYEVTAAAFGWYKSFNLICKGHPRSESFREISATEARIEEKGVRGKEHPVCRMSQRLREIFLAQGLDEMINPAIINEEDVYKQYGPEAPLILDRVFYLASLVRPDIGISDSQLKRINQIVPDFSGKERLQEVFRDYKKGEIEGDDLIAKMVERLKIQEDQAFRIIDEVFPEFKDLKPEPTRKTLRSHMTSLWFPVLAKVQQRGILPARLFSIGSRFRREQREDAKHLFESTAASVVIMDKGFSMKDGEKLTRKILGELGIKGVKFKLKKITSNYYQAGTDTEVFVALGGAELEVANLGFYSPVSLANYGISEPVFNLGFGVERLVMLFENASDIRTLVYPQLYEELVFSDAEVASLLKAEKEPSSPEGKEIVELLIRSARENRDKIGPLKVLVYEGKLLGAQVRVYLYNWDEGKPLLSFAALNEIYIHQGNIYGLPPQSDGLTGETLEAFTSGTKTRLEFLRLIMEGSVADLEVAVKNGTLKFDIQYKLIKRPAQINLHIPEKVHDYIVGCHKKIRIGGPLFFGVKAEIMTKLPKADCKL